MHCQSFDTVKKMTRMLVIITTHPSHCLYSRAIK